MLSARLEDHLGNGSGYMPSLSIIILDGLIQGNAFSVQNWAFLAFLARIRVGTKGSRVEGVVEGVVRAFPRR